jgi:mono/diheme cytochrome c family protein
MSRVRRKWLIALLVVAAVALVAAWITRGMGFTSRWTPSALETTVMRGARHWATPAAIRTQPNPVAASPEIVRAGMAHWADHCAICHDNDGSGRTPMGKSFYPPAPDMRVARTQQMTDGELFYVIERGVPFTGMPAWGTGTPDGERDSWTLVHFIRRLPALTDQEIAEMEKLNPKSAAQLEQERSISDFLKGKGKD